jgi:phenylpyruvate tautomerase PptA (4-oxalocrotonate tautomerase family)
MEQNIKEALRLYCEGGEDSGAIVGSIDDNLKIANDIYQKIKLIFENDGIKDFVSLPKMDADCQEFKVLFKMLSQIINGMKFQGMIWKNDNDIYVQQLEVCKKWIDNQTRIFDILYLRYKDLFKARNNIDNHNSGIGYNLTANLSEVEKEKIDADYLEKNFRQIIPTLIGDFDEIEKENIIKDFSSQLGTLSSEQQQYVHIIIDDIKNGKLIVGDKTLKILIAEYKENIENNKIIEFANKYGLNETILHKIYHTVGNHDIEIGKLCDTCDKVKVEKEFNCKWIFARAKLNKTIKEFIS